MRIMVDPGHGGADPGAVSASGLRESNVNLDVSMMLGRLLQAQGHTVRYTRTTDVAVSLSARARMANEWPAQLFVSIHCNAVATPTAHGTETIHFPSSVRGRRLAQDIQTALVAANGLRDRGVKAMNLAVLRLTHMPAALVELAFLSNPHEAMLLGQNSFRETCARGIAEGIRVYAARS